MALEPLHVQEVLFASSCALVPNQMIARQDGNHLVCKRRLQSTCPRVGELHAIDRRDHVDANRSDANLKDSPGNRQVGLR